MSQTEQQLCSVCSFNIFDHTNKDVCCHVQRITPVPLFRAPLGQLYNKEYDDASDDVKVCRRVSNHGMTVDAMRALHEMLWTGYLMILENDGLNERQLRECARLDGWLRAFWFEEDDEAELSNATTILKSLALGAHEGSAIYNVTDRERESYDALAWWLTGRNMHIPEVTVKIRLFDATRGGGMGDWFRRRRGLHSRVRWIPRNSSSKMHSGRASEVQLNVSEAHTRQPEAELEDLLSAAAAAAYLTESRLAPMSELKQEREHANELEDRVRTMQRG
ncbi:hypothetical protein EDB89DRAFT_1912692 [Lactarius sanguifluus]|nr:hypothetical protein EDB89DRAFT_1912692 [Lactarius sanguifluus]